MVNDIKLNMYWHTCLLTIVGLCNLLCSACVPGSKPVRLKPIPEFETVDMVILSEFALDFQSGRDLIQEILLSQKKLGILVNNPRELKGGDESSLLEDLLTNDSVFSIPFAHDSIWVRDYLGIQVEKEVSGRVQRRLVDFLYRNDYQMEDRGNHQLAMTIPHSVIEVPIYLDGGNFLTNGNDCFLGVEREDSFETSVPHEAIDSALKTEVGCRRVYAFNNPPHEHVDMYLKPIDPQNILVGEIPKQILSLVQQLEPDTRNYVLDLAKRLDNVAESLEGTFKITRIPMPISTINSFESHLNSVLLDKTIIVPRFRFGAYLKDLGFTEELMKELEFQTSQAMSKHGLKVRWVEASDLLNGGGFLHCISFQVLGTKGIAKIPLAG